MKKKPPLPPQPSVDPNLTFDAGTVPFAEFMALLNAANFGASICIGADPATVQRMQFYCARALNEIGPERWNAMMVDLQTRSLPVAKQAGVIVGEDPLSVTKRQGVQ